MLSQLHRQLEREASAERRIDSFDQDVPRSSAGIEGAEGGGTEAKSFEDYFGGRESEADV